MKGYFADIRAQCERLQKLVPNYRYLPEWSKSIQVQAPHNVEQAKFEFAGLKYQLETGSRQLVSSICEATDDLVYRNQSSLIPKLQTSYRQG